jgi:hypothetical protein
MTTSNPAGWVYMDNGIETLRVGACMVVTLMALRRAGAVDPCFRTGPRDVIAERALIPNSVVRAGKAAFYGSTRQ